MESFVKKTIHKVEFQEQEKNTIVLPKELTEIQGFSSIPPFLRIFPDKLALEPVLKKSLPEQVKEKKADPTAITNRRKVEDSMIAIEEGETEAPDQ